MRLFVILALGVSLTAPALADMSFPSPAGWSATASNGGPVDPAHPFQQWHLPGDASATVTYVVTGTSYDDSLAAIHTNFSTNHIKPAVDKDLACQGKTGHIIEFATGPDGHKVVINRMLVPMTSGVAAITYARADGVEFDPAVKAAETSFCAASS